ncbi:hypothetical protein LTR78_001256 [Recurvomyces mirabilis]|uniref:Malate dehydrogenase n=1 Tax=Recurvomyces mirabilis TaxID=574656 RepID=A0AAE0WV89_9PEZI|nr:hypothetical protein LTR78_001256 [Recurvomyces mirabilis]KAK5161232.1 hypothetical protein LTS14_001028 [Recurvomyces mirabilis]
MATVSAAPWGGWGSWGNSAGRPWWTPSQASSYLEFGKRFPGANTNAPTCDMSQAVMPASSPLPAPAAGLSLSHVAIGRGTQNYTCDLANQTAIPVAVGAKATLFNVSCIAASSPSLLAKLPDIALQLPIPSSTDQTNPAYTDMSGHHYFLDATTPFFNMDTALHQYGTGAFKKTGSAAAPSDAMVGQNNQGNGAVAWLKLDAKTSSGQIFQEVYRLNTAGGNPPKTCAGMPAAFEIEYAAEYWLWAA